MRMRMMRMADEWSLNSSVAKATEAEAKAASWNVLVNETENFRFFCCSKMNISYTL